MNDIAQVVDEAQPPVPVATLNAPYDKRLREPIGAALRGTVPDAYQTGVGVVNSRGLHGKAHGKDASAIKPRG